MADFSIIEAEFGTLLKQAASLLTSSEMQEIRHFVDVGEYGLALETAVDILKEKRASRKTVIPILQRLAAAMNIDLSQSLGTLNSD